jgi:hypothetical protein
MAEKDLKPSWVTECSEIPRYKHKRNHDKTGMLLYAGKCFVLEVCGAKKVP